MKKLGYSVLLKKYLTIDAGVLLMLIVLPLLLKTEDVAPTLQRAFIYSGFITPAVCYFEIKKSNQLPFFDNLTISFLPLFIFLIIVKIILSLSIVL